MMTADTQIMRNAAADVSSEEKKYSTSVQEIDNLITSKLAEWWGDEYTSKSRPDLEELGKLLREFSSSLTTAAEDLDRAINSLR